MLPLPSPLSLIDFVIMLTLGIVGCIPCLIIYCVSIKKNKRQKTDTTEESIPLKVISGTVF